MRFCGATGVYFHMLSRRLSLALCAFAMTGWAASSTAVGGPVTGFVFDAQADAIRPMLGIPGAAYLGTPVVVGVSAASVAPDGSAVLAVQQAGLLMLYGGLRSGAPTGMAINGAIAGVDHFAWSGDNRAAAVYSSTSGQAQVLTNLAQSPAAGAPFDISTVAGPVTALAFDGQRIVFGVAGGAGGIYLAVPPAAAQRIAPASNPSAMVLAGADLYFADQQSQQIWQVESYAGTPMAALFADDSGISSPAGLQISLDGKRLYVANAGNRKLGVYDVASRSVGQSLDLTFTPTRLERFGDTSVFLLNSSGPDPLFVLSDGSQAKIAVYFVPTPLNHRPRRLHPRPI